MQTLLLDRWTMQSYCPASMERQRPKADSSAFSKQRLESLYSAAFMRIIGELGEWLPSTELPKCEHQVGFNYSAAFQSNIKKLESTLEIQRLVDYLRINRLANAFPQDDNSESALSTWKLSVLNGYLYAPLIQALKTAETENRYCRKETKPWVLSEEQYKRLIDEVVDWHGPNARYMTLCPLGGITLEEGAAFDLDDSIRVRAWGQGERQAHDAKHHHFFGSHLGYWSSDTAVAELRVPISSKNRKQEIFDLLDLLKWSLFVSLEREHPVVEDLLVFCGPAGHIPGGRRREAHTHAKQESLLTTDSAGRCRSLIAKFRKEANEAFNIGVTFFSRASAAESAGDRLLDSAIGLERLLVAQAGEISYRFKLYGAVLFSHSRYNSQIFGSQKSPQEIFTIFKKIYDARSKAAHNGELRVDEPLSLVAQRALAYALAELLERRSAGTLPGKGISDAVSDFVLAAATQPIVPQ